MERIQTVSIRNGAFEFRFFQPVKLCFPVFKWSLCQESVFIHTTNSPGVSTWLPVSPQPQKAPLVGARLSIVIEQRQTPACCVGDRLKERQCKHSQTTCSPRAEGLASLQAHLHTIPQFWGSQPRRWSRVQEGEESFPDGGNLWRQLYWWSRWHLREAMKG